MNPLAFSGKHPSSASSVSTPVQGTASATPSECNPQNLSRLETKSNKAQSQLRLPSPKNNRNIAPNSDLEDDAIASAFLRENTSQSDRIIHEYHIPLPQGITDTHALITCLDTEEAKKAKKAVQYILQVHDLEKHFSELAYNDEALTSQKAPLIDLAYALQKKIYIKKEEDTFGILHFHTGRDPETMILRINERIIGGRDFQVFILNSKEDTIESKIVDCILIDQDEWKESSNKLEFLAKKCFINKELHDNYPRSYGEFLKKALQQSCQEKYDQGNKARGNFRLLKKFHFITLMNMKKHFSKHKA
jgi:hypothetical protein